MVETSDSKSGKIIETAPNKFVKFLWEYLLNIVNGHAPINKTKIKGYEKLVKTLLSKQKSSKQKRKL